MARSRVIGVALVLTASGCFNAHSGTPSGTVTGRQLFYGGPPPGGPNPLINPFSLVIPSGATVTVRPRHDGSFRLKVAAGSYAIKLAPKTGPFAFEPRKLTIPANRTVRLILRVSGD